MIHNSFNSGTGSDRHPLVAGARRVAAVVVTGLLLCLIALPALAHDDDEAPAPPDPQAQAAAAQWTIGALSLMTGFGVYYFMQRHRVLKARDHGPEWEKKMGIGAVVSALVSTVLVWGVLSAFSRPASPPINAGLAPGVPNAPPPTRTGSGPDAASTPRNLTPSR